MNYVPSKLFGSMYQTAELKQFIRAFEVRSLIFWWKKIQWTFQEYHHLVKRVSSRWILNRCQLFEISGISFKETAETSFKWYRWQIYLRKVEYLQLETWTSKDSQCWIFWPISSHRLALLFCPTRLWALWKNWYVNPMKDIHYSLLKA